MQDANVPRPSSCTLIEWIQLHFTCVLANLLVRATLPQRSAGPMIFTAIGWKEEIEMTKMLRGKYKTNKREGTFRYSCGLVRSFPRDRTLKIDMIERNTFSCRILAQTPLV